MDDVLICDYCLRDIVEDEEYIETKYGDIYCNEDELLDALENDEYFTRKYKGEENDNN